MSVARRPALPSLRLLPRHLRTALLALAAAPALAAAQAAPTGSEADAALDLDRVVVTAAGFEQAEREAPASITVITREELEAKAFHGLAEALADVEGIDIGDSWDKTGAPSIAIRGMPADYTLLLIDGRRQNAAGNVTPNGFGGTANHFIPPLAMIERIEVIRGPMSTLYGSDAMGGVVNIITRKVGDAWHGSVGLDTQLQEDASFGDTRALQVYLGGPIARDRLALALWGNGFRRDEAEVRYTTLAGGTVTPIMGANPVAYDNHGLGARLTLTPSDDHDLWLEATRHRQAYDNSSGQLGTLGTGGYLPTQRYERDQGVLAWTGRFAAGTLDATLTSSRTETLGRTIPPGVAGAGTPRTLEAGNDVLDAKYTTALGAHVPTVGLQVWEAELVDGVAPAPFDFRQWALFAEDEWTLRDDLRLTLGVRRDDHSTFGGQTSPRAYLVWNADARWTIKGGISRGFKTPRVEQLAEGINGFGNQGRLPLIGSPGLTPETSTTTEVSVAYVGDDGLSAGVGLFHNDFQDKIATGTPVANCTFAASPNRPGCVDVGPWPLIDTFGQAINIDEATTRGLEAHVELPLGEAWSAGANYTFTDSEQKSGAAAGQPLTNTPRHMLNAHLDWAATGRLGLYLRGQYRSSRYRGAGLAQDQLGDWKAATTFTLGGRFALSEAVSLNAAILNLTDEDFVEYAPYVTNLGTGAIGYANLHANPDDGRRLWLSMNVDF